ncbi:MAG TPA: hypothetical protein VHM19_18930 [Polyangiales bacterium]|jgi:hypothetical protein|nr:hypothetical protein [Polyangiales bacterium]
MEQDETALVKQALAQARKELARAGRVLPSAYMLVQRNPQTGAPLMNPTAIGTQLDKPLASREEYLEFLGTLRTEAKRLAALAVALCGEAEAEIEEAGKLLTRRVLFVRIEDRSGVHHLHASIDPVLESPPKLGELLDTPDATDDVDAPLLPPVN